MLHSHATESVNKQVSLVYSDDSLCNLGMFLDGIAISHPENQPKTQRAAFFVSPER